MARKPSDHRIEPSFDDRDERIEEDGFVAQAEDRIMPSKTKGKRVSSRKSGSRGKQPRRHKRSRGSIFGRLIYWGFIACIWGGVALVGLIVYYGAKMPSVANWEIPDRPPNVRIVSVDKQLIANRGMTGGEAVGLHEMSPYIAEAVIAIEDRRFYSHFGVDLIGLGRAMAENLTQGRLSQGGSTLTQQLAKNLFLKPDRTIERKVQEAMLAIWLEREYSKDQILEMYLNRVYFGSGAYGVEAASRRYFQKSAKDVTLAEAALLAGLLKAPSRLSPARDPEAANARAQLVLTAMRQEGMIDDGQLKAAVSAPASRAAAYWTGSEHYVADKVMEVLPDLIGEVRSDLIVESTVDMTLQKIAEKSIRNLIDKDGKAKKVSQGALVSIDNSGAVRALVGGYDYSDSQFDRASEARRQPGSAFKPFVYLAAIEQGRTPMSMRNDAPITIGNWTPKNYGGKYYGQVTLTTALAKSLNSVAAQLAMEVGPQTVVEAAQRMGIQSPLQSNISISLGTSEVTPLELTAAYVPFANGGYRPEIHFVQRVTTSSGEVLYEAKNVATRVLSPEVVGMMNAMMTKTIEEGTGHRGQFGWPAAGKTGTSQNSRDAWFVGYTSNLTTGVWFGNDDNKPMDRVTGGALPTAAWHDFMAAAHEGVQVAALPGEWNGNSVDTISDAIQAILDQAPPESGAYTVPDNGQTGSIAPVPPVDIGGGTGASHEVSIMDVILGRQ
ncbi:transglycosylase domain-containing protein [Limoniibacter endophyticus]|uniref:Penicillin-binding protein n=1 Tax=Limoniibacter endophyticus TaxID=1565040 RepID=A0A8J3GHN7_9HYPH|nr:transglycosylase domain-containing protein [Limoniibacter endophyticus]GHC80310.1 penicillin-binding protein [Limoniibacter endophyticus]